jgi:hypothetical protein
LFKSEQFSESYHAASSGLPQNAAPPSRDVFAHSHDYHRRLEWDTHLYATSFAVGYETAGVGVVSVCQGRWRVGRIPMKTRYLSFRPPCLATVKLVAAIACFAAFAATILAMETHQRLTSLARFLGAVLPTEVLGPEVLSQFPEADRAEGHKQ